MGSVKLSICIATYNRGRFIGETLDSILSQMQPGIELVVVDGASPDNTPEVMTRYQALHPEIRYYREQHNSGVDRDYDKAVVYANGNYCWLMTDDDLIKSGAISCVLAQINTKPDLIIINSEVKNIDFSKKYAARLLKFSEDKEYGKNDGERFFTEVTNYLTFIGGVVIKRQSWIERDRSSYYGTLFIHVGVIFQHPPIENVRVIAQPLITIRYGNAMWTQRRFEIWTFKWPQLIWSFSDFSDNAKQQVVRREPHRNVKKLFRDRALGAYSKTEIQKYWPSDTTRLEWVMAYLLSVFPASLANFLCVFYLSISASPDKMVLHDLLHSKHASMLGRLLAKVSHIENR